LPILKSTEDLGGTPKGNENVSWETSRLVRREQKPWKLLIGEKKKRTLITPFVIREKRKGVEEKRAAYRS